jgi:hypothetical protein
MKAVAFAVIIATFLMAPAAPPDWIQTQTPGATIFYEKGYEADRDFAQLWLTRTEDLMKAKYAVTATGYEVGFYLYSAPNEHADVGHAQTVTSGRIATIHYLAPSASAWKSTNRTTSLRFPYDDNFHAKVIISEYIALAHVAAQDARTQRGGWRYYAAPSWVSQGLQEYDAIFHSTEFNRTVVAGRLREIGAINQDWFACCQDGLPEISDVYNAGALFMWYLAERFGEDIHRRLLQSTGSTFALALAEETKSPDIERLFEDFRRWCKAPQP